MRRNPAHPRLIVGISGASGAVYGARLLALLRPLPVETHLVMSRSAEMTLALETDLKPADLRARADVVLKERRRLVLLVRETPLHTGHLRTMTALSEMGAVIAPPVPAFYAKPQSLEEMIDHTLGRALDLFGFDTGTVRRWGEAAENAAPPTRSPSPAPRERVARPKGRAG